MKTSICFGCGVDIDVRGFCSQKCHDEYYNYLLNGEKSGQKGKKEMGSIA